MPWLVGAGRLHYRTKAPGDWHPQSARCRARAGRDLIGAAFYHFGAGGGGDCYSLGGLVFAGLAQGIPLPHCIAAAHFYRCAGDFIGFDDGDGEFSYDSGGFGEPGEVVEKRVEGHEEFCRNTKATYLHRGHQGSTKGTKLDVDDASLCVL